MVTEISVTLQGDVESCALAKEYLHSKEFMKHLDVVLTKMKKAQKGKKKPKAKIQDPFSALEFKNSKVYRG